MINFYEVSPFGGLVVREFHSSSIGLVVFKSRTGGKFIISLWSQNAAIGPRFLVSGIKQANLAAEILIATLRLASDGMNVASLTNILAAFASLYKTGVGAQEPTNRPSDDEFSREIEIQLEANA